MRTLQLRGTLTKCLKSKFTSYDRLLKSNNFENSMNQIVDYGLAFSSSSSTDAITLDIAQDTAQVLFVFLPQSVAFLKLHIRTEVECKIYDMSGQIEDMSKKSKPNSLVHTSQTRKDYRLQYWQKNN
jgi:hypothetical protein